MKQTYKYLIIVFSLLIASNGVYSQTISGRLLNDKNNTPIEFALVFNESNNATTTSNEEGEFFINAVMGDNLLKIQLIGFEDTLISIPFPEIQRIDIKLRESGLEIDEIYVEAEQSNLGEQIIRKAIDAKKRRPTPSQYTREIYRRANFITHTEDTSYVGLFQEQMSKEYFIENRFKKEILFEESAEIDKSLVKRSMIDIDPRTFSGSNRSVTYYPYLFFDKDAFDQTDIYKGNINERAISDRPVISPLNFGAFTAYNFRLIKIEEIGKDSLLTISITPKGSQTPFWNGELTISTEDYYVRSFDLQLLQGTSPNVDSLRMKGEYQLLDGKWIIPSQELSYRIGGKKNYYDITINNIVSDWEFDNVDFNNFSKNEKIKYAETAITKDTSFFSFSRPIPLEINQQAALTKNDSLYYAHQSPEYIRKQDSIYNHMTWRNYLFEGFRRKNRSTGFSYNIGPVLSLFRPLGIGGLRIMPTGGFSKEFANATQLSVSGQVNYGVRNEDWKGRGSISYVFWPKKFGKIRVFGGDNYDFITTYQSIDAIFSRSNYVRNTNFGVGYSMEIINGIYWDIDVSYEDKRSIANLQRSPLLDSLFGALNEPFVFERYKSLLVDNYFIIKFNQEYISQGKRKIPIPNNAPTLTLRYTKGVPTIFNSEVNYDYIEAKLAQQSENKRFGTFNYQARFGSYISKKSLRFAEYEFFRGSTPYFFTSPIEDFQLLGPTLSTLNTFVEASIMHHFDGFILDRIPLINRLQMEVLAGAGVLSIPSQDFYHGEAFVGIGKKFRIFTEIMQVAIYYIVSDDNQSLGNGEFKIGVNFFNAFTEKWLY